MRAALLLLLVGCGKPTAPDPQAFARLGPAERCTATEARGAACADELLVGDLVALGDPELEKGLRDKLDGERATAREARAIHRTHCTASDGYAAAVRACWDVDPCDAFVACVAKHDVATPAK